MPESPGTSTRATAVKRPISTAVAPAAQQILGLLAAPGRYHPADQSHLKDTLAPAGADRVADRIP